MRPCPVRSLRYGIRLLVVQQFLVERTDLRVVFRRVNANLEAFDLVSFIFFGVLLGELLHFEF